MLMIDLYEHGRAESALDILSRYVGEPNMFVSFQDIEKLGIHPTTMHDATPLGIYAYPLPEAFAMMQSKTVPFASGRKWIYLFRGEGNILDLQDYTDDDLEIDIGKLADMWPLYDPNEIMGSKRLENYIDEMPLQPGKAIYWLVSRLKSRAGRHLGRSDNEHVVWNSLFRKLGYSGLVDHGDRIIHSQDHTQAVFFSLSFCRVVQAIFNDHHKGSAIPREDNEY